MFLGIVGVGGFGLGAMEFRDGDWCWDASPFRNASKNVKMNKFICSKSRKISLFASKFCVWIVFRCL